MLKDAGFKVVAHMMPNLLGSTPEKDITSMQECFENQLFRPDELKIYPAGSWGEGEPLPEDIPVPKDSSEYAFFSVTR